MQTHAAAIAAHPSPPKIAATFALTDPAERRICDTIQRFYAPDGLDRLHAIRRTSIKSANGLRRLVWTLGSFCPQRKGAKVEWTVAVWDIDEISVRFQPCEDAEKAQVIFELATQLNPRWRGLKLPILRQASAKRSAKSEQLRSGSRAAGRSLGGRG